MLKLQKSRGCLFLVADEIDTMAKSWLSRLDGPRYEHASQKQKERDGDHYHLTVLHRDQVSQVSVPIEDLQAKDFKLHDLGLGMVGDLSGEFAVFVVLYWPAGAELVKSVGLPADPAFHITLGFSSSDIHDASKGIDSITIFPGDASIVVQAMFDAGDYKLLLDYSRRCGLSGPLQAKAHFKLGNYADCIGALEDEPSSKELQLLKVQALMFLHDYHAALLVLWQVALTEMDPSLIRAFLHLQTKCGKYQT